MLESPDKLDPKKALIIAGYFFAVFVGWYGRGKFVVYGAQPHYTAQITELLANADSDQFSKTYSEALKSSRRWNKDFRLIHFQLMRAREDRCDIAAIIKQAVDDPAGGIPETIRDQTKSHLMALHRHAVKTGVYDGIPNRTALFYGASPSIDDGTNRVKLHVDHIVPASIVPQIGTTLLNLQFMDEGKNTGAKSNRPTPEAVAKLRTFLEKRIVSPDVVRSNLENLKDQENAREWSAALRIAYGTLDIDREPEFLLVR